MTALKQMGDSDLKELGIPMVLYFTLKMSFVFCLVSGSFKQLNENRHHFSTVLTFFFELNGQCRVKSE